MALTGRFIRKRKRSGKPSGDMYSAGASLCFLVREFNKSWLINFRFDDQRNTWRFASITSPE